MDLKVLERKNTAKLLLSLLGKEPKRFKDLKKVVSREATLSVRIQELEELKLIQSIVVKEKRRKFFAYQLTNKGQEIGSLLHKIEKI